jgi:hypothetical protein
MQDSGGSGKFWLVVAGALVAVFLILSFANSRSFRIVEEEGQATVVKGYFLPWGFEAFVPIGAEAAFNPIPWLDPPKGAVLRGNLKSVSQTYYQLLYFAAAEVRDDDGLFLDRDMQAAAFESWFKEKFAGTPGALDQMSELRHKVKENARATEAFVEARSAVLEQIDAMLAGLPDRPSADVQADAAKFQAFLEEMRAVEF